MSIILQLARPMESTPEVIAIPGFRLRNYAGPNDIPLWLALRRQAFARQKLGVRDWSAADFEAEYLTKSWWRPEALWFAETDVQPARSAMPLAVAPEASLVVGTVTLGWRGPTDSGQPVIHWLAVASSYRRRGIGRWLVRHVERIAFDAGHRQIALETHAAWTEAVALYSALGYTAR